MTFVTARFEEVPETKTSCAFKENSMEDFEVAFIDTCSRLLSSVPVGEGVLSFMLNSVSLLLCLMVGLVDASGVRCRSVSGREDWGRSAPGLDSSVK